MAVDKKLPITLKIPNLSQWIQDGKAILDTVDFLGLTVEGDVCDLALIAFINMIISSLYHPIPDDTHR